jgi:hypothetical protein
MAKYRSGEEPAKSDELALMSSMCRYLEIMVAKHRAEAERLNERYREFHATVMRVVAEEAPAVRVVTDVGSCPAFGGSVLVGWLSIGGLREEVNVTVGEYSEELAYHRTRAALLSFRHKLGSRALRGGGR